MIAKILDGLQVLWTWMQSIDLIVLLLLFVIVVLVWHLYNHERTDVYSPIKKMFSTSIFVGIVFVTTIICNLLQRDMMAAVPLKAKNMQTSDIISFYNNIIAYLSFAFVILSVIAYNSIKVLTEEKATKLIQEMLEKKKEEIEHTIDDQIQDKLSGLREEFEILQENILKNSEDTSSDDDNVENLVLTVDRK